jgi:hypothetical protein
MLLCLLSSAQASAAPTAGHLSGLILNESGQPISDVLVSLLRDSSDDLLPTLTRSNESGRIRLRDLDPGTYQILIKSAQYRSPVGRIVKILPNRTVAITLILQQLFYLGEGAQENVSLKALLRNSEGRRLIFRELPGLTEGFPDGESSRPFFEEAVFEIYTNAGPGANYFVLPGDSWGGTTTNFAFVDSFVGRSDYVFAGQLNSGQDSLWRIKNVFNYDLADNHSLHMFFGYGRMSFEQPSLNLLGNPASLRDDVSYTSAVGTSRLLSIGFEDNVRFGPALTLTWGVELDRFRGPREDSFISPNAAVNYSPVENTSVQVSMASKRITVGNSLLLPDGRQVSLSSPVLIGKVGDEILVGTARHYQGAVTQNIGDSTQAEFAYFQNFHRGNGPPIVAVSRDTSALELLRMGNDLARTGGYRFTARREFSEHFKAEVSYVRGRAPGIHGPGTQFGLENALTGRVERRMYHAISAQFDAHVPSSDTWITALVRVVPNENPLVTIDAASDIYETGNEGINLFVRQVIPLPVGLLNSVGLQFLAPESIEALLDVRNLTNEDNGVFETSKGEVALIQNPRSVRGGISFKF